MRTSRPFAALVAAAVAAVAAGCGADDNSTAPADEPAFAVVEAPESTGDPPAAEEATPTPTPEASKPAPRYRTAAVRRRTTLRASPGGQVLARIGTRTEFGSPRVLAVTGERDGWLRVTASERRNGEHGWIRASSARVGGTDVWIRVDRSRRVASLRRGGKVLRRFPVAVGRAGTETPLGRFAVTDMLLTRNPDSPYGCCAVALSGHQTKLLPGWPGGDRLAIHATPNPETIGSPASLGCMRAHTGDIRALMRRVPLGAPVVVVA